MQQGGGKPGAFDAKRVAAQVSNRLSPHASKNAHPAILLLFQYQMKECNLPWCTFTTPLIHNILQGRKSSLGEWGLPLHGGREKAGHHECPQ